MKNNEDKLQAEIVKYFNNKYCLKHHKPRFYIFSIPNGGNRNVVEAMKLQSTGLKAGVSDLIILKNNKTIFVELKTYKGVQSEKQKEFEKIVKNLGFEYYLIRSLEQFIKEVCDN